MLRLERNISNIQEVRHDGRAVSDQERNITDDITRQIRQRSITFDTFDFMELDSWQGAWYKSQYHYNENIVKHFGLNIVSQLPDDICRAIQECGGLIKGAKSASSASKPSNIKASSIEKILLESAINELLSSSDKTVIVDIFHRDTSGKNNDGKIESKDNAIPEVHSVVLYKNRQLMNPLTSNLETEILVIDPSNFKSSNHLSSFFCELESNIQTKCKIITLGPIDYKIYKPLLQTGTKSSDSRDCTDISIKIALGLNQSEYIFDTSPGTLKESIRNCITIRYISNQEEFDKSVNISYNLSIRIKQASNSETLTSYNKLARLLYNQSEFIASEIKNPDERDQYLIDRKNRFTEILDVTPPLTYEEQLNGLSLLNNSYRETIDDYTPIIGDSSSDCCVMM